MTRSKEAQALIDELREVCRRHGLSLGHEDDQGAFVVKRWDRVYDEWLSHAADESSEGPEAE